MVVDFMIETCQHTDLIHTHNHPELSVYGQYDPTRTLTLRRQFVKQMRGRFKDLRRTIEEAIVERDVFGLQDNRLLLQQSSNFDLPPYRAFDFPRSADKVAAFDGWLQRQVDSGVLQTTQIQRVGRGVEEAWTNTYISDSYKRGVIRARYELGKAGYQVPSIEESGGITATMNTPMHIDRVGLLYTRTFEKLRGLTSSMRSMMSEVLAQGMADGDGPRLLARKMRAIVDGTNMGRLGLTDTLGRYIPAQRRSEMIARTEIIRAHHQATMQEYRNWGAQGIKIKAEWVTAGDNRVCPICESWEIGGPYTLDEVQNTIPAHPDCRCVAIPVKKGREVTPGRRAIQRPEIRELTDKEGSAIINYTTTDYSGINTALRTGRTLSSSMQQQIDDISSGLRKASKHEGTVYRGMKFDKLDDYNTFNANIQKGNYLSDEAFLSTSKSQDVATNFYKSDPFAAAKKRVQLKINAKGKNGVNLEDINIEKREQEVLFNKNTKFKINNRKTIIEQDKYGDNIEVELIEVTEL